MRIGPQAKTGRVKVYRFRLYDVASEDFKISARMATPACIRRIRGEIIKPDFNSASEKDGLMQ